MFAWACGLDVNHPWNYDSNGNLIGTVVIREQVALDPAQLSGKRITVN